MIDRPADAADVIVVGGGTAGAIVAARHVDAGASVIVVEAGPDYGPLSSGRWPLPLLDATTIATLHDWGYIGSGAAGQDLSLERARVIGGCSAHNGCTQSTGWRGDYDAWGRECPGWSATDVAACFERAYQRARVRTPADAELQPFHRTFLEACAAVDIPRTDDLADLDGATGVAVSPVNIVDGVRWNTAFSYLDPARISPRLTIIANTLAAAIELDGTKATGVCVIANGQSRILRSSQVIVCAGAYGTPALLLRSGIGPAAQLSRVGVPLRHHLRGVGANLQDQPVATIEFPASPLLNRWLADHIRNLGPLAEEQTVAKLASPHLHDAPFDHHLFPWIERDPVGQWRCIFALGLLRPRSVGNVRLRSTDPDDPPNIDHRYLSDPEDVERLLDTLMLVEDITKTAPMRRILGPPTHAPPTDRDDRTTWLRRTHRHYWHPTSTARMGPDSQPDSVVDNRCRVLGLTGLTIADASVFPNLPRATTALPVAMLAERYCELTIASTSPPDPVAPS